MTYQIFQQGESFSFPTRHAFTTQADGQAKAVIFMGSEAGQAYADQVDSLGGAPFVLIELSNECLGIHIGDEEGPTNVLGFARFRLGSAEPTNLVELVHKPWTNKDALAQAKSSLEAAGLVVAVCQDFPGRILNRLLRPYYNAALRRLDDGLASAKDMDATLRMGLGYPEGPIALLNRTGLADHFKVTQALYEQLGQEAYAPARRARTAWLSQQSKEN
jgi:3-hydroxybutyryl-CoA dehydrogenase